MEAGPIQTGNRGLEDIGDRDKRADSSLIYRGKRKPGSYFASKIIIYNEAVEPPQSKGE